MRRPSPALSSLSLLALLASACRTDIPEQRPEREVAISAVEVESLPVRTVELVSPLCSDLTSLCAPIAAGNAAVSGVWRVVVGQVQKRPQLVLIDSRDGSVRQLGGYGSGPGEYRQPMGLHLDSSGAVTSFDPFQRRFIRFAPDGSPLAEEVFMLPDGFIDAFVISDGLRILSTNSSTQRKDSASVSYYKSGPFGQRLPLLGTFPVRARAWKLADLRPIPAAFAATDRWRRAADGALVHSSGASWSISRFDSTGRWLSRVTAEITPRDITVQDLSLASERRIRGISDSRMRRIILDASDGLEVRHPAITDLRPLADGRLWVRESVRAEADSVRWIVLGPGQIPEAIVHLADGDQVLAAADNLVLMVRADENGDLRYEWVRLR